jgi:hypothetical protein
VEVWDWLDRGFDALFTFQQTKIYVFFEKLIDFLGIN